MICGWGYTKEIFRIGMIHIDVPKFTIFAVTLHIAKGLALIEENPYFERFVYSMLPGFLLLKQSLFSRFCVYFLILIVLFYIKKPTFAAVIGGSGFIMAIIFMCYRGMLIEKIELLRNPFSDPWNYGYGAIQSMYSIASGGIFGVGIGEGFAKYLVPNLKTDYVLSGIGQEIGIFGVVAILVILCVFFARGIEIALSAYDHRGLYLAIACSVRFIIPVFIHVGVTTNLLPAMGVSLPFVSYGGSSILWFFCYEGILLNISQLNRNN